MEMVSNGIITCVIVLLLVVSGAGELAAREALSIDDCRKIAIDSVTEINNAIEFATTEAKINSHGINPETTLRSVYKKLRQCGYITRNTQFEDLFNYASGLALRLSVIINDSHDKSTSTTISNMHMELVKIIKNISEIEITR